VGLLVEGGLGGSRGLECVLLQAKLLMECLTAYKAMHHISPSPRVLMRIARRAAAEHEAGGKAEGEVEDSDGEAEEQLSSYDELGQEGE